MATNSKTGEYNNNPKTTYSDGQPGTGVVGTLFDGYRGGVSAPTLNAAVTTYLGVEERSITPDTNDGDDSTSMFTQNAQADDSADN